MSFENSTQLSITVFIKVKSLIDSLEEKLVQEAGGDEKRESRARKSIEELRRKLRSRAREIPGLIMDLGLASTMAHCLAKAEKNTLEKALEAMSGNLDSLIDRSEGEAKLAVSVDKLAYSIMCFLLLKALAEIAGFKEAQSVLSNPKDNIDKIFDVIEELAQNKAIGVSGLIEPYLLSFKRLCEAEFPAER